MHNPRKADWPKEAKHSILYCTLYNTSFEVRHVTRQPTPTCHTSHMHVSHSRPTRHARLHIHCIRVPPGASDPTLRTLSHYVTQATVPRPRTRTRISVIAPRTHDFAHAHCPLLRLRHDTLVHTPPPSSVTLSRRRKPFTSHRRAVRT